MRKGPVEWPTVALIFLCYAVWLLGLTVAASIWLPLGMLAVAISIALHASLQHEIIHGHPFPIQRLNEAFVFPALNLVIPFERFRDTHLAHHRDANLTDPYDDPESNFLSNRDWEALPSWARSVLRFNNTLLGRLLVGPFISQIAFLRGEVRLLRGGETAVLRGWALHGVGVGLVLWVVHSVGAMPFWAYLIAAYLALSILKIRTFLEHRAHDKYRGRSVIIEDRGILAFLFLNNNFHALHHMHPSVAWYDLPVLYARTKARVLTCNEGYVYRSYGQIFRAYFLRAKDEVVHPLWHRD